MKIKIRKAIPADVYRIREVQKTTWFKTYPSKKEGITVGDIKEKFKIDRTLEGKRKIEERKKKYKDRNTRIWVVEYGSEIVGFCSAIREKECNRIGSIYILPVYQRRGLGKRLIEKAFSWLGGRRDIFVNVARYNGQAITFYENFGFTKTGKKGNFDSAAMLPSGKYIPEIELVKKNDEMGVNNMYSSR
jgi:ribosomal protein S18 acetylase RimI-like enzyme